jgi:hypothetical protein
MITAWLNLNSVDPEAYELTYIQIPEHYVYCKQSRQWKRELIKEKQLEDCLY